MLSQINLILIILISFMPLSCTDDTTSQPTEAQPLSGEKLEEARTLFEGRFALRVQSTTEQELPVVGLARSTSYMYKILTVRESDGLFNAEEQTCFIRMETEGPAAPSIPMALVDSIPIIRMPLKITQQDGDWQWERSRSGLVIGAQVEDPLSDPLPTEESDARVYDQDRDGYPGVTLNVSGLIEGDIYSVIRYVDTLSGGITSDGVWEGSTHDESEQIVIGASQDILNVNVTPVAVDDPSLNVVTAISISAHHGKDL